MPEGPHPEKLALLRDPHGDDIHGWFELTYANYLVLERTLLQSMPGDWQRRMVECLEELRIHFEGLPKSPMFHVQARDLDGRFMRDPVPHYNRGRSFVPRTPRDGS